MYYVQNVHSDPAGTSTQWQLVDLRVIPTRRTRSRSHVTFYLHVHVDLPVPENSENFIRANGTIYTCGNSNSEKNCTCDKNHTCKLYHLYVRQFLKKLYVRQIYTCKLYHLYVRQFWKKFIRATNLYVQIVRFIRATFLKKLYVRHIYTCKLYHLYVRHFWKNHTCKLYHLYVRQKSYVQITPLPLILYQ